ncbi:hypothetical protein [Anaerolinea sp.]|uniref:hypothetical protein n=1 Tax=Anaerolinea sp. TaxID=1872519 RepID=UPI002ACE31FA|nr:hypothetical protein [Anaerolinea sp.]
MLADLNRQLLQTAEALRRKTALTKEKQTLENTLQRLRREVDDLKTRTRQTRARLQALEGTSLQAGWHSLLGDRDEQITRARQELQSLEGQIKKAQRAVEETEARLLGLEAQLKSMAGMEEMLENLLRQKEQALMSSQHPLGGELQALYRRQSDLRAEKREVGEALQVGLNALDRLKEAIAALESASGMGVWDMLGGGALISAFKHSRLNDARAALEQAQATLNHFARELRDVQVSQEPALEMGGFELFFDVIADGLLVDWWVQSKISTALKHARDQHDALIATLNRLNQRYQQMEQEEEHLRQRRLEILRSPV